MSATHLEEFVWLADVTDQAALLAWGGFWFRRDGPADRWRLLHVNELGPVDPGRTLTVGARSEPYGDAVVTVYDDDGAIASQTRAARVNHAWVTGLRPDTRYHYRVTVDGAHLYGANVNAQAGAYATGILAMMASAAVAVTVSAWRRRRPRAVGGFGVVTVIVAYALLANIIDKPDGIVISLVSIAGVVVISLVSRLGRTTELRADDIEFDDLAAQFIQGSAEHGQLHLVANERQAGDLAEYRDKEIEQRDLKPIPPPAPVLFLEIEVTDPSEFSQVLQVRGSDIDGYRVLRAQSPVVPHALAAIMLRIRDETGLRPHLHFQWSEGNPFAHVLRYLLLGQGEIAPVTREVLRQAEKDVARRPVIHVGG